MCFQAPVVCWTHPHRSTRFLIWARLAPLISVLRLASTGTVMDSISGSLRSTHLPGQHKGRRLSSLRWGLQAPNGPAPLAGQWPDIDLEVRPLSDSAEAWLLWDQREAGRNPRRGSHRLEAASQNRGLCGPGPQRSSWAELFFLFSKNIYNVKLDKLTVLNVQCMALITFTMLRNHHHFLFPKLLHHPKQKL